jgi:signal transduction histidine kinase
MQDEKISLRKSYLEESLFAALGLFGLYVALLNSFPLTSLEILNLTQNLGVLWAITGMALIFHAFRLNILSGLLSFSVLALAFIGSLRYFEISDFIPPNLDSEIPITTGEFILGHTALLIGNIKNKAPSLFATIIAIGMLILAIATIGFVGEIYGIGHFSLSITSSIFFFFWGILMLVMAWINIMSYSHQKAIPWYMMPVSICILSTAMVYWLLLIAYPSLQNDPELRPEEILTIILLIGIIYYLRQNHQNSKELDGTLEQLHVARDCLVNQERLASLGVLVAGIAHEIKNPLNYIYNFSELSSSLVQEIEQALKKHEGTFNTQEQEELRENIKQLHINLASINKQSAKANNTIHHMLLHARSGPDELVPVNLNNLLDEYLTLSYQGVRARSPAFNVIIEKSFATPYGQVYVHVENISRVFLNIFNNAFYALEKKKNREEDSFQPTLTVKTAVLSNFFEIRIRDNGDGISEEVSRRIFTPFFTTKPAGEGTGLGLSLSRSIIENEHGGTLTFISEPGNYSEFIIRLPATNIPEELPSQ